MLIFCRTNFIHDHHSRAWHALVWWRRCCCCCCCGCFCWEWYRESSSNCKQVCVRVCVQAVRRKSRPFFLHPPPPPHLLLLMAKIYLHFRPANVAHYEENHFHGGRIPMLLHRSHATILFFLHGAFHIQTLQNECARVVEAENKASGPCFFSLNFPSSATK